MGFLGCTRYISFSFPVFFFSISLLQVNSFINSHSIDIPRISESYINSKVKLIRNDITGNRDILLNDALYSHNSLTKSLPISADLRQEELTEGVMLLSSHPHPSYLCIYNLPWRKIALLAFYRILLWRDWPFIFRSNLPPTCGSAWNSISTSSGKIDLRHWFLRCWIKVAGVRQIDSICRFLSQFLCYTNHFYIFQPVFWLAFKSKNTFPWGHFNLTDRKAYFWLL